MSTTKTKSPPPKNNIKGNTKPKTSTREKAAAILAHAEAQTREKIATAQRTNNPAFLSMAVTESFSKTIAKDVDITYLLDEINHSIDQVQSGNLAELEALLLGQAKALQTMFMSLARRANNQEYLKQYTTYMNLALKSQSQSRATIQALVELKYPRQVVVTQQANFSAGHQQVNNGTTQQSFPTNTRTHAPAHAEKNQNEPNELMDGTHEQTIEAQS